jgi:hypothetical protein
LKEESGQTLEDSDYDEAVAQSLGEMEVIVRKEKEDLEVCCSVMLELMVILESY